MSCVPPKDGFFPITSLHREDLRVAGFEEDKLSDGEMEELARRLGEAYTATGVFWDHLKIIAEEMGVKKLKRREK